MEKDMTSEERQKVLVEAKKAYDSSYTVSGSASKVLSFLAKEIDRTDNLNGGDAFLWRALEIAVVRSSPNWDYGVRCIPKAFSRVLLSELDMVPRVSGSNHTENVKDIRECVSEGGPIRHSENYEKVLKYLPKDAVEAVEALTDLEDMAFN